MASAEARSRTSVVPKRKRINTQKDNLKVRRSGRLRGIKVNLDEDALFRDKGLGGLHVSRGPARRGISAGCPESRYDSGLGVRRQGGRIYDSKNGVTCHWCRQKTLEDHVVCTSESCGGGKTLPVSFCRMCLWNRHGENVYDAIASGKWICPKCRGGCGDGCRCCCNCGPCRKKNGLGPTFQMVKEARVSGFDNVHDYLIHLKTKETSCQIMNRKHRFEWGRWLSAHEQDPEATESDEDSSQDENDSENPIKRQPVRRRSKDNSKVDKGKITRRVTRSRGLRGVVML